MSDKVLLLTIGAPPLPNITPIVPVATTPTVDGHTAADLAPPTSLQTLVTVDAVQLTWQPSAAGDGVEYFIEAVADVGGSPSGSYAEVAVTGNTTITLPLLTGKWFRVRARLNGRVSAPTAAARCIPGITVSQISGVIARMPAGDGTLATEASVMTEATARANGDSANAALINTVSSQVAGKAEASAVQSIETRVTVVEGGYGVNLLKNPGLAIDARGWGTVVWNQAGDSSWAWGRDALGASYVVAGTHSFCMYSLGAPAAGYNMMLSSDFIEAAPGSEYIASGYLAAANVSACDIRLSFYDASFSSLSENGSPAVDSAYAGGTSVSSWQQRYVKAVAPAGTKFMRFVLRCLTSGAYSPRAHIMKPMIERALSAQEAPSTWNLGPSSAWASWDVTFDVNGNISGMSHANDGSVSNFNFNADYVNFITSSDTGFNLSKTGFDRRYGAIAIYEGDAFGTDSLVYWIGPKSIGKASAKKSNATLWFDATGNAYFGGTLSAGVFKNGARSSQFGGSVQVETGEFGTNGNPKVVTASCVYSNTGYVSSSLGNASLTGSFVVERSIGGGAWSTVASGSITGNRTEIEYEPGLGYLTEWFCSASVTFTDTDASTSNFNYRIRLTGASGWPYNLGGVVGLGTQTTSILSTEE